MHQASSTKGLGLSALPKTLGLIQQSSIAATAHTCDGGGLHITSHHPNKEIPPISQHTTIAQQPLLIQSIKPLFSIDNTTCTKHTIHLTYTQKSIYHTHLPRLLPLRLPRCHEIAKSTAVHSNDLPALRYYAIKFVTGFMRRTSLPDLARFPIEPLLPCFRLE